MRSLIMISPQNDILTVLHKLWINSSQLILEFNRLSISLKDESVFVDYLGDIRYLYDTNELICLNYPSPYFYSICYSDRETMKYFIENTYFDENTFFDNDHGKIVSYKELRKLDILEFIE